MLPHTSKPHSFLIIHRVKSPFEENLSSSVLLTQLLQLCQSGGRGRKAVTLRSRAGLLQGPWGDSKHRLELGLVMDVDIAVKKQCCHSHIYTKPKKIPAPRMAFVDDLSKQQLFVPKGSHFLKKAV